MVTLFVALAVAGVYFSIANEVAYQHLFESFEEVRHLVVDIQGAHDGDIAHLQSSNVSTRALDDAFGVTLQGALQLRRHTEYCQWEESSHEGRDENNQTYTEYSYIKTWRSYRINSFVFDQPAAHHNPQRDPLPSATFTAESAEVFLNDGSQAVVSTAILERTYAPWRSVDWTLGAVPRKSWFSSLWKDTTRYESISALDNTPSSFAARRHGFVYVGQGGYFFSAYETSLSQAAMKYFFQYLEGSLLDWQLGDLMPSCTAGDIRVWYGVQDPQEVSVVGRTTATRDGSRRIDTYQTAKGHEVGMLHAGYKTSESMMSDEIRRQQWWCLLTRLFLAALVTFFCVRLREVLKCELWPLAASAWGAVMAVMWLLIWGMNRSSLVLLPISVAGLVYVMRASRASSKTC